MKPYTTPILKVEIDIPIDAVAKVKFIFKQEDDQEAETILTKKYPEEVKYADGVYRIPFTQQETGLFKAGCHFYMDTQIVDHSGHIPETNVATLFMSKTLFSYEEATV